MAARRLATVVQPCVLCEADVMSLRLMRDDETGHEAWEPELLADHLCAPLKALMKERG